MPSYTRDVLLKEARSLKSEHGENSEYDRALVELIYYVAGGKSTAHVAVEIGVDPEKAGLGKVREAGRCSS